MKQTLVIRSPEIANRACEILRRLPSSEHVFEVVIRPHKKDRSVAQNALLWSWNTIIAAELGETKEAVHERNKERFLVPIYERDNLEYAEMIEAVRRVYRSGAKHDALALKSHIVRMTSTTTATVAQFTEFLTEIERDAASLGIVLPRPEDLYYEALGSRRAAA